MAVQTNAERGRDVRARLLAAAQELIAELGWNGVSTRVLAERAGVHSGLVHYHFASLQALLRQAAVEAMRPLVDGTAALLAQSPSPADAVESLLAEIDRYTGTDPASLVFIEAYLAATRDPDLRDQMSGLVTGLRATLAEALTRAGHQAPEAAAITVMAVVDGFLLHKGLDPQLSAMRLAPMLRRLTDTNGAPS
ncbi:TetR/AcrR family transcriptional regulator [Glycomyces tritici]|uniref:TetR/AcrR family transcriptional regulator n=1 Tax=Glycomyces tritici TaxID=2665176 RepID=A0ABT7YM20_9ACTN|nr:TetR/AcrR family transcriptional regulator [Glycomyces tritici]MDN3239676.1 TetR/AcrR family transcriptional regulator [Glycomyces tritici]